MRLAHVLWTQQAQGLGKLSQSAGLQMPAALAVLKIVPEECTVGVLRALWAIRGEFSDLFFVRPDDTPWASLYPAFEERVCTESIDYLPGGLKHEEIHRERHRVSQWRWPK